MVDTDTFLTVLHVMADDFCKLQPQHRPTPGPKASLTESEVITLVIFGQWARFRSERDFCRYAQSRLRPAFPTLPRRSQFNRLTRRCYGTLSAFFGCLAGLLQGRCCPYEALRNFCIWLNRQQGRPSLAFVDLLGWWHHLFHTKRSSDCIHYADKDYHNTRYCTDGLTDRSVSRR